METIGARTAYTCNSYSTVQHTSHITYMQATFGLRLNGVLTKSRPRITPYSKHKRINETRLEQCDSFHAMVFDKM